MAELNFVLQETNGVLEARYTPPIDANFAEVEADIPMTVSVDRTPIEKMSLEELLDGASSFPLVNVVNGIEKAVELSCPNNDLCGVKIDVKTKEQPQNQKQLDILAITGICNRVDCPLNDPPSSDSEPLNPTPTPPSLAAHADV